MIKAILTKPLDGEPEGAIRELSQADFERLEAKGAVRPAADGDGLRQDGPTIAEYMAAGYKASSYPPHGYVSRSTPEEIAVAVAAETAAEKAAPVVKNKMAPAFKNKADGGLADVATTASAQLSQDRKG